MINTIIRDIIARLKEGRKALVVEPFPDKPNAYQLLANEAVLVEYMRHKFSAADDPGPRRVTEMEFTLHFLAKSLHRDGELVTDELYNLVDHATTKIEKWQSNDFSWVAVDVYNEGEIENHEGVFLVTMRIKGGSTRSLELPRI